jgi:hypothetical protein
MTLTPATYTVPPDGWYVEVDLPDGNGGTVTRTPEVAGDPQWTPSVNHLPRVDIPIPSAEYWLDGRADSAPIRVWLDGTRLPIEEIETVEQRKGNRRDELRLRCLGGIELQQRIQRVYQNRAVPDAVERLINSETTLTPNIDEPDLTQTSRTTLLDVSTADEFRESLRPVSGGEFGDSTVALEIDESSDVIRRTRSSWLWTAAPTGEADLRLIPKRGAATVTVSRAGEEQVVQWDDTDQANDPGEAMVREADLPPPIPHDIPDSEIGVKVRVRDVGPIGTVSEDIEVAFETTATPNAEFLVSSSDLSSSFAWIDAAPKTSGFDGGLNAGDEITLVEALAVDSTEDFRYDLDAIALYDKRFSHSFDNDPTGGDGGGFVTPQPFGGSADIASVTTGREFAGRTLSGADVAVSLSSTVSPPDPSGLVLTVSVPLVSGGGTSVSVPATVPAALGVTTKTTTETGQTQASVNPAVTPETARTEATVALSGRDTQANSPTAGVLSHQLDSVTLSADATPETRLLGESFDSNLLSVLQDIGEVSRSIWAVEVADSGSLSLEWTRPGVRETSGELSASAVDIERITQRVEAVSVIGGRVREQVDVTAVSGTAVDLPDTRIIPGTEQVRPANGAGFTTTGFEQLSDYRLDYQAGTLTATTDGEIDDGAELTVQYAFRPSGRFESGGFAGDARLDEAVDISTATTSQQAAQAARRIVQETPDARTEATVELGGLDPSTSVVSELSIDALSQVDGTPRVTGLTRTPGNPTLRLGTARPLSEIVEQVERDLRDVRRRI